MISPFRIAVPEADLADLRARLRRTRWPEAGPVDDWSQGTPLGYLRSLCEYWASEYDWRRTEARLNRFPQYRAEIDGLGGVGFADGRELFAEEVRTFFRLVR
jgi:epoxide hydrolase